MKKTTIFTEINQVVDLYHDERRIFLIYITSIIPTDYQNLRQWQAWYIIPLECLLSCIKNVNYIHTDQMEYLKWHDLL